jgi:hypothetical protein
VTAQIATVLVGARTQGFDRSLLNISPGTGLGLSAPLGRGFDQQCPFVISPPVKSLDLGLRRPWLRPRTSRPGSCNLTGSLCGYQKRSTFAATARG